MASCSYPDDPIYSPNCNGLIYPEGVPLPVDGFSGNKNNLIPGGGGALELQDMDGMGMASSSSLKVSNKPKTKGKKRSRTSINGEEQVDLRTLENLRKILNDRLNRRIQNDEKKDLLYCLYMIKYAKILPPILEDSLILLDNWPMRNDLKNIKKKIDGIKINSAVDPEIIKKGLEEVDKDIRISDEERKKITSKVYELSPLFLDNQNYSNEDLKEKLSEAFPWLFVGKTATNWPDKKPTPDSEQKYADMEKELFENNKEKTEKLSRSDFQCLNEAVRAVGEEIPLHLKPIAIKMEEACGKIVTWPGYQSILILVCAAIYEMENCKRIELLEWERLVTWAATYNMAKEISVFKLQFFETHLKKILKAYCAYKFYTKERVQDLKAELEMMEDCTTAKDFFDGNCLSHGLFP